MCLSFMVLRRTNAGHQGSDDSRRRSGQEEGRTVCKKELLRCHSASTLLCPVEAMRTQDGSGSTCLIANLIEDKVQVTPWKVGEGNKAADASYPCHNLSPPKIPLTY